MGEHPYRMVIEEARGSGVQNRDESARRGVKGGGTKSTYRLFQERAETVQVWRAKTQLVQS